MSNVKVLNLEWWMKPRTYARMEAERQECLKRYKELIPVFNRPGRYKLGKLAWFEVDGKAYVDDMFDYHFNLLEAERYNHRQVDALRAVVAQKMATKEQRRLLQNYEQMFSRRVSSRRARLYSKRFIKSPEILDE